MGKLQDFQKEKIIEIISEFSDIPEGGILPETELKDGLGFDSLDIVEVVMKFEETFDCNIPDEDYEHVKTVNDIFKVVQNRVN
jgi:acyl carrier protein